MLIFIIIVVVFLIGVSLGSFLSPYLKKGDGILTVEKTENGKMYNLELKGHPEELESKKSIVFKIVEK